MNLTTEAGKRRFLAESRAIALYNTDKEPAYRIRLDTLPQGSGTTIVAEVGLKPTHNLYRIQAALTASYPAAPPDIRFLEPAHFPSAVPNAIVPHLLRGNRPCLFPHVAPGNPSYVKERWDPSMHTVVFAILATWRWCLAYDFYLSTGRWVVDQS